MMRSLYSGVAGLKTHQTKMDVIGNNISNVNTVAFKSASTTFSDIMYQTTSGASAPTANKGGVNAKQIGLGVANGATKVSITSSGAAQSTGEAFDIRLTDSNSTNFFIVNNGTENLFTRAGSFYIDSAGNLAMTTTGYLVQGWQVDPATLKIRQDVVSPLRIMQPANLTSPPEATTDATISGVIDKNDTNVTSEQGYYRSLSFYDNLGYAYTAKFAYKVVDPDNLTYSVSLVNILDSEGNNVLEKWMEEDKTNNTLDKLFGTNQPRTSKYELDSDYTYDKDADTYSTVVAGVTYTKVAGAAVAETDPATHGLDPGTYYYTFEGGTPTTQKYIPVSEMYGIDNASYTKYVEESTKDPTAYPIGFDAGQLSITYPSVDYTMQFKEKDGTLDFVNAAGNKMVTFNTGLLGEEFKDINLDFTSILNYDNSGSSTVSMDAGTRANASIGAGKKLGALTGVSVSGNGEIYGSYDNGNTVLLGQIAVAQFSNASGLESLGNNCYGTTLNSGQFDGIGVDVTADGGSMSTGQLEMSNVDLSAEFTDMIVTQRGFQANSRIITTSDTLLEELINLKR